MSSRRLLLSTVFSLLAWSTVGCNRRSGGNNPRPRIVSLAPDLTHTLYLIGALDLVVGVSDYCQNPPQVRGLPRVGTSLTPNYEAITRLAPTLILSEANQAARKRELSAITQAHFLPWLALPEVTSSIRELGKLTLHEAESKALAERLNAALNVPPPAAGPRVLAVLGDGADTPGELWFVRQNSLHGAALNAAGAQNAMPEPVLSAPRISYEKLVQLDPDAILILALPGQGAERTRLVETLRRFETLKAARKGRISVLESAEAFANGPRILDLVSALRARFTQMGIVP